MDRDDTLLSTAELESLRNWLRITAHRLFQSTSLYDTSDVVQDVLVEYSRCRESLRDASREEKEKWLYATLQRKIADVLRKQSAAKRDVCREQSLNAAERDETLIDSALSPERQAELADDLERVRAVMTELTELQQEAVRLKYVERLTIRQIADRFGCDHTSVSRLLRRGLMQLQERLNRRPDPTEPRQGPHKRGS
jgi:RNA polymerase sigma-70 factor (ECF subfamily)